VLLGAALLAADPGLVERRPARGEALPLGEVLFASWVLPFELVSVLLLAALVAAVAVSRGREAA
jgi:NADH:ubiquinone oxidoreductase subunit 6 (subunit J)